MSSSANEITDQLHVYHNPFATHTSQPKIPDGKAIHSIGFSTQFVEQIDNSNAASDDVLHMLLYPGMNSALIVSGTPTQAAAGSLGTRAYYVPAFQNSNGISWDTLVNPAVDADVTMDDGYAKWRIGSLGLQLKLLNSVEEDDGWWEACRVNEALLAFDWQLSTVGDSTNRATDGCVTPLGLLGKLELREIANEPTYSTGLLRDLNRIQFECHPTGIEHDFQQQKKQVELESGDYLYSSGARQGSLLTESPAVFNLIENFVDFGHDMVYIRLHCRPRSQGGSRFHVNCVSNQEIVYDTNDRLARYQTRSHTIGSDMEAHTLLRRKNGAAASLVL